MASKVRFDEQLRKRYGRFPPVEVRYDEFAEDIEENRLLKAAITRLGQMSIRLAETRQALRAFDGLLATVRSAKLSALSPPGAGASTAAASSTFGAASTSAGAAGAGAGAGAGTGSTGAG